MNIPPKGLIMSPIETSGPIVRIVSMILYPVVEGFLARVSTIV